MTQIKPIGDRVLIKPAPLKEKTETGIYIPDTAKEKPQIGEVIAVGEGTDGKELTVKVGQQVLYGKYAGTEVDFDGENLLIMRESDIYAIM